MHAGRDGFAFLARATEPSFQSPGPEKIEASGTFPGDKFETNFCQAPAAMAG